MTTKLTAVALLIWLAGCGPDTAKEPPVTPLLAGKADVVDRVVDVGPLAYGAEAAVKGEITEDLEFHGYRLAARAGAVATVEITQLGSSRSIDTTLLVYGPRQAAGGYGTSALAADDDSGWGRLSRLRSLTFAAGGDYLVVVGTADGRGRGRYRLAARCESGACSPAAAPPAAGACHDVVAGAIAACVEDYLTHDPDWRSSLTKRDLFEQCAEIEAVAPAYDAACASTAPPAELCALSLEQLAAMQLPRCLKEAWSRELDAQCVLGDSYSDLFLPGALVILRERQLTAGAALTSLEQAQLLVAVQSSAHSHVTTVAEALAAVDQGLVNQTELWDASNRRGFTAFEYGAGDSSYGAIFEQGLLQIAARIVDGDLYGCTTTWGPEMRECEADQDCAAGLSCHGIAAEIGRGRCIAYAAPEHPEQGASCQLEGGCAAGSGLLCAGAASSGGPGTCQPAWLTGRFFSAPEMSIPDNAPSGAESQLVAYGLATVDVEVKLDLVISHPRLDDLRVSLINPAGTEAVIFDRERDGSELYLNDFVVHGFSGDEQVNGIWRLRVVDWRAGETGAISSFGLTITSRWD